jgi:hypothetical protein
MQGAPFGHISRHGARPDEENLPDPEVGEALRHALSRPQDGAFVARVLASAAWMETARTGPGLHARAMSVWDVLAAWARPGIALAAAAALLTGMVTRFPSDPAPSLDQLLAGSPLRAALLAADTPPDAAVLLETGMEP